jgi:hypothetical protein
MARSATSVAREAAAESRGPELTPASASGGSALEPGAGRLDPREALADLLEAARV